MHRVTFDTGILFLDLYLYLAIAGYVANAALILRLFGVWRRQGLSKLWIVVWGCAWVVLLICQAVRDDEYLENGRIMEIAIFGTQLAPLAWIAAFALSIWGPKALPRDCSRSADGHKTDWPPEPKV